MPRNGVGTFSVINPIEIGTLRSSAFVNEDFTDAGNELTNTIPLDGSAGMTGAFRADEGSLQAPGLSFVVDQNVGFRLRTGDEMAWVSGATDRAVMDANGKLTFTGGLQVTGTTNISSALAPQSLFTVGQRVMQLRRVENDTSEHELATYESGSGAGARGSIRVVGSASNNVSQIRFYVNDILAFGISQELFSIALDTQVGVTGPRMDSSGFFDLVEITAPSAPGTNIARIYSRDMSGDTEFFYKDAVGAETNFSQSVDRQVFTASNTWTKPGSGSVALVEVWAAGASGSKYTTIPPGLDGGGGGGGGGGYCKRIIALASLSSSVSITVGAGGLGILSANTPGNSGGSSSFGLYLITYGGEGGSISSPIEAGGGGGLSGINDPSSGGPPLGALDLSVWGIDSNPFGGSGSSDFEQINSSLFGGSGGGSGATSGNGTSGGNSVFGGAGGGGSSGTGAAGLGGSSILGGSGGSGATGVSNAQGGSVPGGGGGAAEDGNSGSGARGEVRITVW